MAAHWSVAKDSALLQGIRFGTPYPCYRNGLRTQSIWGPQRQPPGASPGASPASRREPGRPARSVGREVLWAVILIKKLLIKIRKLKRLGVSPLVDIGAGPVASLGVLIE